MSGNRAEHLQPEDIRRSINQQAAQGSEKTWAGGGREPVHPDDIDDEGEYVGKHIPKQQLRSDDN